MEFEQSLKEVMRVLEAYLTPGTTLLVHTVDGLIPNVIQDVQTKKDFESGRFNHSGKLYPSFTGQWRVYEATEMPGRKLRGVVRPTPLEDYVRRALKGKVELRFLVMKPNIQPDTPEKMKVYEQCLYDLIGTPYDIGNLLIHQLWFYKLNVWIGRKKAMARRSVVCHEYSMTVDNDYTMKALGFEIFENPHQAQVYDIYHSLFYEHFSLQGFLKAYRPDMDWDPYLRKVIF